MDVAALGRAYLDDYALAPQLLEALVALPSGFAVEHAIDQAWLNVHWDQPCVVKMLVDIADFWNRMPEPRCRFFETCWQRDDASWHHFIDFTIIEGGEDRLANLVYRQFLTEGPSDHVIDSLYFLSASLDSDRFADTIMVDIVNRGAIANPCLALLKLWRRYNVVEGLHDSTLVELTKLLAIKHLANDAIRVVECLQLPEVSVMLPSVAALASHSSCQASRRARRILVNVSDTHLAPQLAHVVCTQRYHVFIRRLHYTTLMQKVMLAFLVSNGAIDVAICLWNDMPDTSLRHGVYTAIMEMDPGWMDRVKMVERPDLVQAFPTSVHQAIYYMYMRGEPPPSAALFRSAYYANKNAVHAIAKRAHLVKHEINWMRRAGLLLALNAFARAQGAKKRQCTILTRLARAEYCWPSVFQYL